MIGYCSLSCYLNTFHTIFHKTKNYPLLLFVSTLWVDIVIGIVIVWWCEMTLSLIGTSTLPAFVPLREMLSFPPLHFYIHMSVNSVQTIDTPPFKCHLSCQLVSEMKGMTFLLSKRFYSNSSCDIIVQCLWPNDMQQFYHTIFWDLLHLSFLVLALEVLVVDGGLLVLLVLAHLDSYM